MVGADESTELWRHPMKLVLNGKFLQKGKLVLCLKCCKVMFSLKREGAITCHSTTKLQI